MNWKFWQKEKHSENSSATKEVKLAKPNPEMILFFGAFNRKTGKVLIEQTLQAAA